MKEDKRYNYTAQFFDACVSIIIVVTVVVVFFVEVKLK